MFPTENLSVNTASYPNYQAPILSYHYGSVPGISRIPNGQPATILGAVPEFKSGGKLFGETFRKYRKFEETFREVSPARNSDWETNLPRKRESFWNFQAQKVGFGRKPGIRRAKFFEFYLGKTIFSCLFCLDFHDNHSLRSAVA